MAHQDTLSAVVKGLKPSGRVQVVPVGHWNACFAGAARVTPFAHLGTFRRTLLTLKPSGQSFAAEVDKQPSNRDALQLLAEPVVV